MSKIIGKNQGVYNNTKMYAVTNITTEDHVSHWDGAPIILKAGKTASFKQHLADKITNELVDKIIQGNAKLDEVTKSQPYYRSPIGMSLGVPAAREVWEDQIVKEIAIDEETPEIQVMKAEIKAELLNDMSKEKSTEPVHVPTSLEEFSELKEGGKVETAPDKAPIPVVEVKVAAPKAPKKPKTPKAS